MKNDEKRIGRSTYVQLKEEIKNSAVVAVVLGREENYTCRVAVNVGLELLIAGVELLKMHGVTKTTVLEFVERLFDRPGDIQDMIKGGKNEYLLRMAMRIINGPLIRHTEAGDVIEGDADGEIPHDAVSTTPFDPTLN